MYWVRWDGLPDLQRPTGLGGLFKLGELLEASLALVEPIFQLASSSLVTGQDGFDAWLGIATEWDSKLMNFRARYWQLSGWKWESSNRWHLDFSRHLGSPRMWTTPSRGTRWRWVPMNIELRCANISHGRIDHQRHSITSVEVAVGTNVAKAWAYLTWERLQLIQNTEMDDSFKASPDCNDWKKWR